MTTLYERWLRSIPIGAIGGTVGGGKLDTLEFNNATATPQIGIDMHGRDIIGMRNIQGGKNLAVLGASRWNLDIGAGTSDPGARGNLALNFDVGRGMIVYDGSLNKLVAINETADNTTGTKQIIATAVDPAVVFTILRAAAAQAQAILQVQMSDGTVRANIDQFGRGEFSNAAGIGNARSASLGIGPLGAADKGIAIRGNAAQTGALLEALDSANNLLLSILAGGGIQMLEQADPAAPPANSGILYVKDNGAAKSQLVARFPTGAVQVIATEP